MTEDEVVRERAEQLMKERFKFHHRAIETSQIANAPYYHPQRMSFETWAIQKIAGLQCAVEELERRIADLKVR